MLRTITRFIFAVLLTAIVITLSPGASALPDGRLAIFHAKISPDGTRVAFTWQGDIWVADIASGNVESDG